MKELVPAIWDDLDRTERDTKTPADVTRHVGLDGVWKELDLTSEHDAELLAAIKRYMDAGLPPSGPVKPLRPPKRVAAGERPYPSDRPHGRRTKQYYDGLAAYVDERGITKRDNSGRPAYQGTNGKRDFPSWLVEEYDAYLEQVAGG